MTTKRFTETISTGIVTDTTTGKKYNCEIRIDDELLKLLNELAEENRYLKEKISELSDMIEFDTRNGIKTYSTNVSKYLINILKELKE